MAKRKAKKKKPSKRRIANRQEVKDSELGLTDPRFYLNRELSLLEFDERVLAQSRDPETPLLERLRFLTICSANLDEFFEIRVAGLKEQRAYGVAEVGPARMAPGEVLDRIAAVTQELVREQYRVLNEELLPELVREGVRIRRRSEWTDSQAAWIRRTYLEQVHPVLTPIGLDPSHPFPKLQNKSLNFIVALEGADAFGRDSRYAVVQVPRSLPRIWRLPTGVAEQDHDFVLLSSIVHAQIGELFSGMNVMGCYQFRLTRNSELWVDEEEVDNLLQALQGELPSRKYGEAVRLEVAVDCPEEICQFLLKRVELEEGDLYRVNGPVNAHRLSALYDLVDRPDLKYPPFVPGVEARLRLDPDIFEVLQQGDVLLHHPYQSFQPVLQFLEQAAKDPKVLAIKQTVYRTDRDSPIAASTSAPTIGESRSVR